MRNLTLQKIPEVLRNNRWNVELNYNKELIEQCQLSDVEKEFINNIDCLVSTCLLDKKDMNHTLTIDYMLPICDKEYLAKGINKFVTSALITDIKISVLDLKSNIEYSYLCVLSKKLPDWNIKFTSSPDTHSDILLLRVVYDVTKLIVL